jgi:putative transposase
MLMRQIDVFYLKWPFYGSRRMTEQLRVEGLCINRKRVQRLMREMGLEAIYPKPNLSKPHPQHKKYPYLLRNMLINRVNQVWGCDITYIPMAQGHVYLVAIIDWYSRYILSWRVSNTLDNSFCVDALKEALERHGNPEIFNTDQGVQFTSADFTKILEDKEIKISMDGKGRCLDNVFTERLWRSLKQEEIYLKAYATIAEARSEIGAWFNFYNTERMHQSLDYRPPAEIFYRNSSCGYVHNATRCNTYPQLQKQKKVLEIKQECYKLGIHFSSLPGEKCQPPSSTP